MLTSALKVYLVTANIKDGRSGYLRIVDGRVRHSKWNYDAQLFRSVAAADAVVGLAETIENLEKIEIRCGMVCFPDLFNTTV